MVWFGPVNTTIKGHVFSAEIQSIVPGLPGRNYSTFLKRITNGLKTLSSNLRNAMRLKIRTRSATQRRMS